ncbi:trifunctional dihydropteroate synthetase, partial [Mortierella sp. GBA43]
MTAIFRTTNKLGQGIIALLKRIKEIETDMGRDLNTIHNVPRPIDIDVLLYDSIEHRDDVLTILHVAMQERKSVLRPLC